MPTLDEIESLMTRVSQLEEDVEELRAEVSRLKTIPIPQPEQPEKTEPEPDPNAAA